VVRRVGCWEAGGAFVVVGLENDSEGEGAVLEMATKRRKKVEEGRGKRERESGVEGKVTALGQGYNLVWVMPMSERERERKRWDR
jgi:hypothetical protein